MGSIMHDIPIVRIEHADLQFVPRPWQFAIQRRSEIDAYFATLQRDNMPPAHATITFVGPDFFELFGLPMTLGSPFTGSYVADIGTELSGLTCPSTAATCKLLQSAAALLVKSLGPVLKLFVAKMPDGEVISGGLFTLCDGIVQHHLGGTRDTAVKLSPMVLVLETVSSAPASILPAACCGNSRRKPASPPPTSRPNRTGMPRSRARVSLCSKSCTQTFQRSSFVRAFWPIWRPRRDPSWRTCGLLAARPISIR